MYIYNIFYIDKDEYIDIDIYMETLTPLRLKTKYYLMPSLKML